VCVCVYLVLHVVQGLDMLLVELLWRQGSHAVEGLVLVSVLPADGVRRAAQTHADHPEHLDRHTHTIYKS